MVDTRYKTFWRRVGAMLVDGLFLWPVTHNVPDVKAGSPFSTVVFASVGAAVPVVYSTLMHAKAGQTVGKVALGVIVLNSSQTRIPGWRQSAKRDVFNYGVLGASFVLFAMLASMDSESERWGVLAIGFGVGFAWLALFAAEVVSSLTNDRRRSIHDAIADTVVVKTAALGDLELRRLKASGGHADSRTANSGRGW